MNFLRTIAGFSIVGGLTLLSVPRPAIAAPEQGSNIHKVEGYTIILDLFPAEKWTPNGAAKPKGEMQSLGGAQPVLIGSKAHPNHHLVVFLKKDGKPVEHAMVQIRYRLQDAPAYGWTNVPVDRMDVSGAGSKTTHYGNNVYLTPGVYAVQVTVNRTVHTDFTLDVKAA